MCMILKKKKYIKVGILFVVTPISEGTFTAFEGIKLNILEQNNVENVIQQEYRVNLSVAFIPYDISVFIIKI